MVNKKYFRWPAMLVAVPVLAVLLALAWLLYLLAELTPRLCERICEVCEQLNNYLFPEVEGDQ